MRSGPGALPFGRKVIALLISLLVMGNPASSEAVAVKPFHSKTCLSAGLFLLLPSLSLSDDVDVVVSHELHGAVPFVVGQGAPDFGRRKRQAGKSFSPGSEESPCDDPAACGWLPLAGRGPSRCSRSWIALWGGLDAYQCFRGAKRRIACAEAVGPLFGDLCRVVCGGRLVAGGMPLRTLPCYEQLGS
eukprot:6212938-Pleurochrysis_carterae.AAC.5